MRGHEPTSAQVLSVRVALFGALVAGALAGCGGSSSGSGAMSGSAGPNAPLTITQSNATATAAEAIVTPAMLAGSGAAAVGTAASAAVPASPGAIARRVVQRLMSTADALPAAGGTVTVPCAVGGSFTAVTSADGKTVTVAFT